jgi:hypothetical protein
VNVSNSLEKNRHGVLIGFASNLTGADRIFTYFLPRRESPRERPDTFLMDSKLRPFRGLENPVDVVYQLLIPVVYDVVGGHEFLIKP